MGLEAGTLAAIGLAFTAAGTVAGITGQQEAASDQRKARREQQAVQAAQRAQERRQQIREERVKRARILQASENTGVTGSSGEAGAVGGLATQLQSNVGFNLGMQRSADAISNFQQNAQDALDTASMWKQLGNLGGSIFMTAAGMPAGVPSSPAAPAPNPSTLPANISRGGGFSPGV